VLAGLRPEPETLVPGFLGGVEVLIEPRPEIVELRVLGGGQQGGRVPQVGEHAVRLILVLEADPFDGGARAKSAGRARPRFRV
jgi:hypothetical protein